MDRPIALLPGLIKSKTLNNSLSATLPAPAADSSWFLPGVVWSFAGADDMTPIEIGITAGEAGIDILRITVTNSGPGFINFPRPIKVGRGKEVYITASPSLGGNSLAGTISLVGAYTE